LTRVRVLFAAAAGWIAFTCATTRWMEWAEPIRRHYASDELQYESIARAAPGLPNADVSAAASQRFVSHWLVGVVSEITGLGLHSTYRLTTFLVLALLATVLVRLVVAFDLPVGAGVLALGLVITNPYAWRVLLIAPAMLSDLILVLGVAVCLLGMVDERPWVAIAGALIAVLGRETGIAVVVAVFVWLAIQRRFVPSVVALVLPLVVFGAVKAVGESFALSDPSANGFTVITPLLHLPGTARELADHFGRVLIASPTALAILAASMLVTRRTTRELRIAVLLAALVVLQPAFFNPAWVQHNETRLAALGIVPVAFSAAAAFAATPAARSLGITTAASVLVAIASLHHRYTWSGLIASPRVFVGVETLAAGLLALLIVFGSRRDSHRYHFA
jgi:hypothetical protein